MSNGIHAIKGFEYQATVILDRLFDHFDRNGPTARVRPEGIEDLDLYWTEGAVERRHYSSSAPGLWADILARDFWLRDVMSRSWCGRSAR